MIRHRRPKQKQCILETRYIIHRGVVKYVCTRVYQECMYLFRYLDMLQSRNKCTNNASKWYGGVLLSCASVPASLVSRVGVDRSTCLVYFIPVHPPLVFFSGPLPSLPRTQSARHRNPRSTHRADSAASSASAPRAHSFCRRDPPFVRLFLAWK